MALKPGGLIVRVCILSFLFLVTPVRAFSVIAPVQAGTTVPGVPVILVHGAGSGPGVWGVESGRIIRGFAGFLVSKGYEPGKNLYWLDYHAESGEDPASIARDRLAPLVAKVLRDTGAPVVDIVSHGSGALVSRYYLNYFGGRTNIRTLAMVAPPNRGSFAASYYRLLGVIAAQQRFRKLEGSVRGDTLDETVFSEPFLDESVYINAVANRAFEPLFGLFAEESLFLKRPSQRTVPEKFEEWLVRRYPHIYRKAFIESASPPVRVSGSGLESGPGAELTRSYFHALALAVARNNYRNLAPWTQVVTSGWEEDFKTGQDWRLSLKEFVVRRLVHIGGEILRRAGINYGREVFVSAIEALSGLEPDAAALNAQVEELLAPGTPVWSGSGTIKANSRLAQLNGFEARGGANRQARYVTITGVTPNVWSGFFHGTAANDLINEARSALLTPAPLDSVMIYSGVNGSAHGRLPFQRAVHEYIFLNLDPLSRVPVKHTVKSHPDDTASGGPSVTIWQDEGKQRVGLREPVFFAVDTSRVNREGVGLSLNYARPDGLPPGYSLRAFILIGDRGRLRTLAVSNGEHAGELMVGLDNLPEGRGYIGFRLIPSGDLSSSVGLLRSKKDWVVSYNVTVKTLNSQQDQVVTGDKGKAQRDKRTQGPSAALGDKPKPQEGGGSIQPQGAKVETGVPEVVVTYHNKKITDKVEDRTYHVRWEWDFGDGTGFVDDDPSHVLSTVEHMFPPGEYTVEARSWSNKGTLLRELRWRVSIGPEGLKAVFQTRGAHNKGGSLPNGDGSARQPPSADAPVTFEGGPVTFEAETTTEAYPELVLDGPRAWVTGRPAHFELKVSVPEVPFLKSWEVKHYPGQVFLVRWRRPGIFTVQAAVRVKLEYQLPEGNLVLNNTYLITRDIEVMATSVTD